jgi:hypothetical protein
VIKMKINNKRTRIGLVLLVGLFAVSAIAAANGSVAPLGLIPTPTPPTPDPLSVSIWTNKAQYAIGENATIYFSVNRPAYVYIYDIEPSGVVRRIFPNQYSQYNFVSAGTHSLPDGLYKFTVAPPAGTEQLQIFASPVPLNLASMPYGEPFPMVGPDPGSAGADIQAHIMGIVPEPVWATAWTSFLIVASYGYSPPSSPPFFPPFFGFTGGTWFWENGAWYYGFPGTGGFWFWGPDGQWHFRISFHFEFGD